MELKALFELLCGDSFGPPYSSNRTQRSKRRLVIKEAVAQVEKRIDRHGFFLGLGEDRGFRNPSRKGSNATKSRATC